MNPNVAAIPGFISESISPGLSALAKSKSVDSPEAMASYLETQAKLRKKQLTGIDLELLDSENFNELNSNTN